mgnify:CR=1 FL=1
MKKVLKVIGIIAAIAAAIAAIYVIIQKIKAKNAPQGYDEDKKPIVRLYIVLAPDADAEKLDARKKQDQGTKGGKARNRVPKQ